MFLCIQQIHIVILRVQVGFLVRKHLQVLKRHRKLMSEKLHGKSLIQHICIKLLHQEVVFYTKYKMKQLYRCRMHYKKGSKKYTKDEMDQITIQNMGTTKTKPKKPYKKW